jgi:predicted TPR repeat methyltransferase
MSDFDPKKYWEDRLTQSYDLAGVGCLGFGVNYNKWLYRVRSYVFNRIIRNIPLNVPKSRILDIGSGTGFYLTEWIQLKPLYLAGSDIASTACENLKEKFKSVEIFQIDIGSNDFRNPKKEPFDIISAFDVLFHITDDDSYFRTFRNVSSMLSESGVFIFSDNLIHGNEIRLEHFVSRNLDTVTKALSDAGLELISRVPMFKLMNTPMDNPTRTQEYLWRRIRKYASVNETLGNLVGVVLYPFEIMLVMSSSESVSTEIAIVRKKGGK